MARIVIAGSSEQSRTQLSALLSSSGYPVYRMCGGAGELRRTLNDCDDGLLIPAGQMPDCSADELFWDYGEQVLETPARPMNVIDPILWCLKRKGIRF